MRESLDLLSDQRLRRREEEYLAVDEPPVVIEHHRRGDERFTQAGWQRHKRVLEQRRPSDLELVRAESLEGWVDPLLELDAAAQLGSRQDALVAWNEELFLEERAQNRLLIDDVQVTDASVRDMRA